MNKHCANFSARKRPSIQISAEQHEYRELLQKDWARYKRMEKLELTRLCRNILQSQQTALDELRKESEELYQAAIQVDDTLLPIALNGPVHTPPIKNYDSPAEYRFKLKFSAIFIQKKEYSELTLDFLFFCRTETTKMLVESGSEMFLCYFM